MGSGRDVKEHDINTTQNGWCPQKKAGDCKRSVCVCVCLWVECMTKAKSGCRVVVAEHFGLVNDQQKKKEIKFKKQFMISAWEISQQKEEEELMKILVFINLFFYFVCCFLGTANVEWNFQLRSKVLELDVD